MASGNTLFVTLPGDNEPPASGYATLDTRNAIQVLDFDADAIESGIFRGVLPSQYAGGGLTLDLFWMATSATSGDVVWGAAWEKDVANGNDLDADNFGTESTATGTANGTSGKLTKTTLTISSANMGTAAAGDPFRLKVRRVATDGGDTMTGDAEYFCAMAKET